MNMRPRAILFLVSGIMALTAITLLTSCQDEKSVVPAYDPQVYFGDGMEDGSMVVCRVGDLVITERQLNMRMEELNRDEKRNFAGDHGVRLLLRFMVDEYFLASGANERELYNHPDVARTLIMQRRRHLVEAMRNIGLLANQEPSLDDIRTYYESHKDELVQQGIMHARHVQTSTREAADEAYDRLINGSGRDAVFAYVAGDLSVNPVTKAQNGDLGWFNRGGFIDAIPNSASFTTVVWELDPGIHPPIKIGSYWHVIEVTRKDYDRPMTIQEAEGRIKQILMPQYQMAVISEFVDEEKARVGVEYFGDFRPGQGKSAVELFERAFVTQSPEQQLALYDLLIEDYPESDLVDDALFMAANVVLENWGDIRNGHAYLSLLIELYPDSEYVDDARYLLENPGAARMPESLGG